MKSINLRSYGMLLGDEEGRLQCGEKIREEDWVNGLPKEILKKTE